MFSIKRLFAAVGLAGLAALTGCDQQPADTEPTQSALDAKCPAQATQAQKAACIGQATKQSMYALNQTYLNEHERLTKICAKPTNPVLVSDASRVDELLYTQAYNVMECLNAVEGAAPVVSRNYVRTIAQNVKDVFARLDIGQHPYSYEMDSSCPINPTEEEKADCVLRSYEQSQEAFRMVFSIGGYETTLLSVFGPTLKDTAKVCLKSHKQPMQELADNTRKCLEMLESKASSDMKPDVSGIAQGVRRGLERVGL